MPGDFKLERKLSPMEKYFWLIDRQCRSNVLVHVGLAGKMAGETMRAALDAVQARHPLLRVRIVRDGWNGARFISGDVPEIPLRVLTKDPESWTSCAEEDLNTIFPLDTGPLVRATLIGDDCGRATLLITFHHSIGDGISGCYLIRDLLAAAAMASSGKAINLAPLPHRKEMEAYLPPAARGMRGRWRHMKYALRTFGARIFMGRPTVPAFDRSAAAEDRRAAMIARSLPREIVTGAKERARRNGTTLHACLLAAQILAIAHDRDLRSPGLFIVGSPVNLRSMLVPEVVDDFGFFVSIGVSINRAHMDSDFWTLARGAGQSLQGCVDRGDPLVYHYLPAYLLKLMALTGAGKRGVEVLTKISGKCTMGGLGFSNIGRVPIETVYGPYTIESLGFAASGSGLSPFIAFAATIGNRTTWNFVGMEPLLDREHLAALAGSAMEILRCAVKA